MQSGTTNAGSGRYAPAIFETRNGTDYIVCLLARASGGEPDRSPRPWASVFGAEKAFYEPMYKAWKANEEAPIDGFPLTDWPPMAEFARLIEPLKRIGVRSVEALADMAEGNAHNVGGGTLGLIEKARVWIKNNNSAAIMDQNRELKRAVDLLTQQNAILRAENERLGPPAAGTPAPIPQPIVTAEEREALTLPLKRKYTRRTVEA